jgi:osmotically-inducible protein OsmY
MKRLLSIACCNAAALLALSVAASAQTPAPAKSASDPAMTKTAKSSPKAAAPKADADVQKCTQDKLVGSKLKDDNITVAVSGGEATLTGATKIAGHKGNATQFAKRCGATKVTNNITVESTPKTKAAKPADSGGTTTPKKP